MEMGSEHCWLSGDQRGPDMQAPDPENSILLFELSAHTRLMLIIHLYCHPSSKLTGVHQWTGKSGAFVSEEKSQLRTNLLSGFIGKKTQHWDSHSSSRNGLSLTVFMRSFYYLETPHTMGEKVDKQSCIILIAFMLCNRGQYLEE